MMASRRCSRRNCVFFICSRFKYTLSLGIDAYNVSSGAGYRVSLGGLT